MPEQLEAPILIPNDVNSIIAELIASYEEITGKTLQPAQVERLLIQAFAYRESNLRAQMQYAIEQNLVDFANAPMLDYLGKLVGVTRLGAVAAEVDVELTLADVHVALTIPMGLRIQSTDGSAIFKVKNAVDVEENVTPVTVTCIAETPGAAGNGYLAGYISVILDPQAWLLLAVNTETSAGGSDAETDDELRERIKLAPGSYSNAGSRGAYEFFAKSAHPSIIDVVVIGPPDIAAGLVNIYPLVIEATETPDEVLDAVDAACNSEKVRPLTDTVNVYSPTRVEYALTINVKLFDYADEDAVVEAITDAVTAYHISKRQELGQDIVTSQVIGEAMVYGVYSAEVDGVDTELVQEIGPTEFGYCTLLTINVTEVVSE